MSGDGKDPTQVTLESSSEGEGELSQESTGDPEETSTLPQDGQDSGVTLEEVKTPEFQHPLLKGKSIEEIERIFSTQQEALTDVTREANEYHSRLKSQPAAPTPQEEGDDEDVYGDDFIAPKMRLLESRLKKTMEEMVAPLKQTVRRTEVSDVRSRLRKKFQNFETLEPHIDRILREQDVDPSTAGEAQLTMIYHTALGVAIEQGIDLKTGQRTEAPPPQQTQQEGRPPVSIPQHRPSSAPPPKPATPQKRPLTENERILAREYFGNTENPEDEYRRLLEANEDDIVEPGFSKERW